MLSIIKISDKKLLPSLMDMYEKAKQLLKSHGSGQWQNGEPSKQTILQDISVGNLYGLYEGALLIGACAIMDKDPSYHFLHEGSWLNQDPYLVIHRFVIDASFHNQGLGARFLSLIEQLALDQMVFNIRVDTHELNLPMKALLNKMSYEVRGKVHFTNIGERIVYDKVLR
jgi:RimJ/RimL family protein N-acetyltransferase